MIRVAITTIIYGNPILRKECVSIDETYPESHRDNVADTEKCRQLRSGCSTDQSSYQVICSEQPG